MSAPILEARGLVKSYGGRRVVDGIDLLCRAGSVLGLLGPNGAGKTTTLRMLYGFIEPDAGDIRYRGFDFRTHRKPLKRIIGVCTQDDTLDPDFTVRQNLRVYASYFRPAIASLDARIDELLARFGLEEYASHAPRELSGGYKKRLMIARSIVHRPEVLFLDEPTTGLDPRARVDVWELVAALRREGLAVILTTHYMDEAERLSDDLLVLSRGRTLAQGAPRDVVGGMLGEHIVVIPSSEPDQDAVVSWLMEEHAGTFTRVLGELRIPLRGSDLSRFTERFRSVRFSVRPPNLDDLFLRLSGESADEGAS